MKKSICVSVMFLLLAFLCSCGSSGSGMEELTLYDNVLGESMTLNMKKSDMDAIWGEPEKEGDDYLYDDEVAVVFSNGKAKDIVVEWPSEKRWSVKSGITTGSSMEDVLRVYGDSPSKPEIDLGVCFDYVYNNQYAIRFVFDRDDNVRFIALFANK